MTNRIIGIGGYAACIVVLYAAALASAPKPLASCSIPGGTLSLVLGFSHQEYGYTGREGNLGEEYQKGNYAARQFMAEHDGDWCGFGIPPSDSVVTIPRGSRITLTLEDGSEVTSTDILAVGWSPKRLFWSAADNWLVFGPGVLGPDKTRFGLSAVLGGWILYVRFPEGSCLTAKPADMSFHGIEVYGREFRARVKAMRLERGGE